MTTEASPAALFKLTLASRDADEARTIAGALEEIAVPSPDAVTLFEDGAGWRVEAYYMGQRPDTAAVACLLGEALGYALPAQQAELVPQENWVTLSQAALPPVTAGRFTVHGSHDRGRVPRGPNAILIDAGEAFGTAHHATTLGCLLALHTLGAKRPLRDRIHRGLDLGCGSGVLAIAAARTFPTARVLAVDIDAVAVAVAAANIRINGAARTVTAFRADGLSHPALRTSSFDLVLANILAGPLIELARGLGRIVRPGGIVVLSGLLTPQAPSVAAAYRAAGFSTRAHARIAGWSTLTMIKRPARAPCVRSRHGE